MKSEIVKKDEIAAELEAFAYSVTHDLKSPLRAIGGFSQALLEDYGKVLDQTAHGYLNRITRSATRMDSLIDDLLRYSRLGCDELKIEPVPIAEVLAQVKANLKADIEAAGGRIDVRGELPVD